MLKLNGCFGGLMGYVLKEKRLKCVHIAYNIYTVYGERAKASHTRTLPFKRRRRRRHKYIQHIDMTIEKHNVMKTPFFLGSHSLIIPTLTHLSGRNIHTFCFYCRNFSMYDDDDDVWL